MEADWVAERSMLRHLITLHPTWTNAEVARCLRRKSSNVFWSCATTRQSISNGCQDQKRCSTTCLGTRKDCRKRAHVPRSTKTIWKILRSNARILLDRRRRPTPLERREPLQEIQIDFKDDSTVPTDPWGKQQHVVETCNFVDAGTSIWLHAPVREDFTAETALEVVAEFLRQYGLPPMLTFDRDPRWVGSASGRDFPSAFVRFRLGLGIQPHICPPQRPDKNELVAYCTPSASLACLWIFVGILHRSMLIGRREDRHPMIIHAICGKHSCSSPGHDRFPAHPIGRGRFIGGEQPTFA
jgi:hypothetical protein